MATQHIVTLDSLVRAKFVSISSVKSADNGGGYDVCLKPTNDPDVDGLRLHITSERAAAIGLSA